MAAVLSKCTCKFKERGILRYYHRVKAKCPEHKDLLKSYNEEGIAVRNYVGSIATLLRDAPVFRNIYEAVPAEPSTVYVPSGYVVTEAYYSAGVVSDVSQVPAGEPGPPSQPEPITWTRG